MALKLNILLAFVLYLISVTCGIKSKVLLISMDGFRWDYINKVNTPNFDAFAADGTRADYINNTFITKTFPCHYTIATGLYEESHGIVANRMFDPIFNESFNMGTKDTKWWDGGEPMWVTARKHGLKSAVYFWPGSETEIRGFRPNIYFTYNETVPFEDRVDKVVSWLSDETYGIDIALLYFHEPDKTGHNFGPDSDEVKQKVSVMDGILGYIVQQFNSANLWQSTNVIVTSDHGMTEIDFANRHIDLSEYINMDAIEHIPTYGPNANFQAKLGLEDEVYNNLTGANEHMTVYRKENLLERWHYKNNRRILPLLAVADEGWMIVKGSYQYSNREKGTHGFDNAFQSMKPIFYARGPNIRVNYTAIPFNSVDIYPLVCELLGITPAPNNGTLSNTKSFITGRSVNGAAVSWGTYPALVTMLAVTMLTC